MAVVGWLLACHDNGAPPAGAPTLLEAAVAPAGPRAPLSFTLEVTADRPVSLRVGWADEHGPTEIVWPTASTGHQVVLAGFHPDREVPLTVEVTDEGDRTASVELSVATAPLPPSFPARTALSREAERMAPGFTVAPVRHVAGSPYEAFDYLVALDGDGHVVWMYASDQLVYDVRLQPSGALLLAEQGRLVEIDRAGRTLGAWQPEGWQADGIDVPAQRHELHHEAFPLADGGLLTLTWRPRHVESYPVGYDAPTPTAPVDIADDVALAFDRDGTVRWAWSMGDLLDVHRLGYDSLRRRPTGVAPEPADWGHANAVIETEDGSIVASLRHQDAVIRFDPGSGRLRWILANHENWPPALQPYLLAPLGELEWPYHQHAPEVGPDGRVLLFDNGNERASPWTDEPRTPERRSWSRAVGYEIDEAAGTVRQTFAYEDNPNTGRIFAGQLGDADWLDNGNVLVTYGDATWFDGETTASLGLSEHTVRLIEVEPVSGDTVWDLLVATDPATDPVGVVGNRAQRVPTLYPELSPAR